MPQLSNERLQNLAKLTGGVAVLVAVAVFLNGAPLSPTSLVGAVDCSTPGGTDICEEDTIGGATLRIEADPEQVISGMSTILDWVATGVEGIPSALACFGNGLARKLSGPSGSRHLYRSGRPRHVHGSSFILVGQ